MGDSSAEIDNESYILDVTVDEGKRKNIWQRDGGKQGWAQDGGDS